MKWKERRIQFLSFWQTFFWFLAKTYCWIANIYGPDNRKRKRRGLRNEKNKQRIHANDFLLLHYLHLFPVNNITSWKLGEREGSQRNRFTMMHPFRICLLWNVRCEVAISLASVVFFFFLPFFSFPYTTHCSIWMNAGIHTR